MDIILSSMKRHFALVYVNDNIILSKSPEEHIVHMRQVLTLLNDAEVTLNLKKGELFTARIDHFGHIINLGHLEAGPYTIGATRGLQVPTNVTKVRSLLDRCIVIRLFVPKVPRIAALCNGKFGKDQIRVYIELSEEELSTFQTLQERFTSPLVLAPPQSQGPYSVDTDTSNRQVGYFVHQNQPGGHDKPIGHWSLLQTEAEHAYCTTRSSFLDVSGRTTSLPLPFGTCIIIRTEHDSVECILNFADVTGKLLQQHLWLLKMSYDVHPCAGIKHPAPGALSIMYTKREDCRPIANAVALWRYLLHQKCMGKYAPRPPTS